MRCLCALGAALGLAACGVSATHRAPRARPSPVAQAQTTHEYPSPPPPQQRADAGFASASAAVAAFAAAYINWTAGSVAGDLRRLAAQSIGQARSAMQLAAAQAASDYELERGGIANRGTVEAVTQLRGARDQYVVVTRELTTATATRAYQGLRPAWHVALAAVAEERAGQWVVSAWQPES
jgi:hypothetical protein